MSFPHLVADFAEDITVVVGPNGTGKSAILKALFLTFSVKGKSQVATSNYIRKVNDVLAKKAVIKLWATYKGEKLEILTELYSDPNAPRRIHKVVDFQGVHLEDVKATKYLETLFGRETMVSFALQGNEKFLTTSNSQNLLKFMNLLKLDFEKEITYARNNHRLEAARVAKSETDKAVLENSIKSLQSTKSNLLSQIEKTENSLKVSIDPVEIENLNKVIEELTSKKTEINLKLESKKRNLEILNELDRKVENLTNQIEATEKELKTLEEGLDVDRKDISKIEESINETSLLIQKIEEETQTNNKEILDQNNKITEVMVQIKAEEEHLRKLAGSTCPLCTQEIPGSLKLKWDSNLNTLKETQTTLQEGLRVISDKGKEIQARTNELKTQLNTLTKEKSEAFMFNSNLDLKRNKYESCKVNLENLKANKETTLESYKTLPGGLVSTETLEDSLTKLNSQYTEKVQERNNKQNQLQDYKTNQTLNQKAKEDLEGIENKESETQTNLEETLKVWEESKSVSEAWRQVQEVFKALPRLHLKRFVRSLESLINQTVKVFNYEGAKVYYDGDKSELGFLLKKEGSLMDYELCSSFERILLNLAVIYALTRLFELPFICVDELDSSADKKNTKILGTLILEIAKHTTVVTVSHDEGLTSSLLSLSESSSIISTIKGES